MMVHAGARQILKEIGELIAIGIAQWKLAKRVGNGIDGVQSSTGGADTVITASGDHGAQDAILDLGRRPRGVRIFERTTYGGDVGRRLGGAGIT